MALSDLFKRKKKKKMVEAQNELNDLLKQKKVQKILLLPEIFGGQDIPQNVTYVPLKCVSIIKKIEKKVEKYVLKNDVSVKYSVKPHFDDSIKLSYIPVKLEILVSDDKNYEIHEIIDISKYKNW